MTLTLKSTTNDPTKNAGIAERMVHRRAVEAVIWGMPAVNYELMRQAADGVHARSNQIVFWSRLLDWKNQTLTPNPNSIYLMPFINTKDAGPMVLEIPPADGGVINGSVDDGWQAALEDVGPAGVDKGKGGKYLILSPGYTDKAPDGFIALPSDTYHTFALLRSILKSGSDTDIAQAVDYAKRIKLYPLSQAVNPPPTIFVDAIDVVFDSTIPYDLRFLNLLDRFVQREPWLTRDKAMIDQLKSIGIEKGKRFDPDKKTQGILQDALGEAHAWIESYYETYFKSGFFPSMHWALPGSQELVSGFGDHFSNPDSYPIDARGCAYSMAFWSARHLGAGQFYLMGIKDKAGNDLDGGATYGLTVPANAPVKQYWSATAYDRATHALIRDMPRASRSSQDVGLQKNVDGSTDIFFGPTAPAGKDKNWVPTKAGGQFEVLVRFYGPEKALFEKTWVLPDIKRVSG